MEGLKKANTDNIDELINEFDECQKDTLNTWRENCELKAKLHSLNSVIAEKNVEYQSLLAELHEVKTVLNSQQELLSKRCDLDDENRELNARIKELCKREKAKTEEHEKKIDQHLLEKQTMQDAFNKELEKQNNDLKNAAKEDNDLLQDQLEKKDQEISDLQERMKHIEEEKCAEAVRLRTEYDKKLQRYQKHAAKSQTLQNGAFNQEIFRQKLQHMKTESEREVSNLKRTISELQQQLSNYQQAMENINTHSKLKRQRKF